MGKDVYCFRLTCEQVDALDSLCCGRGDAVRFLIEKEVCEKGLEDALLEALNGLGVSEEARGRVERELKSKESGGRQLSVAWF